MSAGLSIQLLGQVRGGRFSPYIAQTCSHFEADRIAVGSRAGELPTLVLSDSTVSPRHALIAQEDQKWVIQDTDSDNGIRSLAVVPDASGPVEPGRQALRFEFDDELCCCVGAVVLRLKVVAG